MKAGTSLSRKIEEAEISHMRTEHIYDNVEKYSLKQEKRLDGVTKRSKTLLGDSILLAASVVFLGPFAPEERDSVR